jgi:hypothetical protein
MQTDNTVAGIHDVLQNQMFIRSNQIVLRLNLYLKGWEVNLLHSMCLQSVYNCSSVPASAISSTQTQFFRISNSFTAALGSAVTI